MSAKVLRITTVLAITSYLTGCHDNKATNHYEGSGTQGSVAVVDNDIVVLDLPSIKIDSGITYISGTVHRRPGVNGDLPGRVDIEFLGPQGEYLDGLPALLTPLSVPVDPTAAATYSTSYGYVPPAGSTVRVHFVDHESQVEEDLERNGYGYGGGSGKTGHYSSGHGGRNSTASHSGGSSRGMGSHW